MKLFRFVIIGLILLLTITISNQINYGRDLIDPVHSKYYPQTDYLSTYLISSSNQLNELKQELILNNSELQEKGVIFFIDSNRKVASYAGNAKLIGIPKGISISQSQIKNSNLFNKPAIFDISFEKMLGIQYVMPVNTNSFFNLVVMMSDDQQVIEKLNNSFKSISTDLAINYQQVEEYVQVHGAPVIWNYSSQFVIFMSVVQCLILLVYIVTEFYTLIDEISICELLGLDFYGVIRRFGLSFGVDILSCFFLIQMLYITLVIINNNYLFSDYFFQAVYIGGSLRVLALVCVIVIIEFAITILITKRELRGRLK